MLAYIQSLALLISHRVSGRSLLASTRPQQPFGSADREMRGTDAGDLVDALVEYRLVMEKSKTLETRMKYQIDKLVRLAEEGSKSSAVTADGRPSSILQQVYLRLTVDPLAFRPNPEELAAEDSGEEDEAAEDAGNIYRPPKLAPVPYTEGSKGKQRSALAPSTLRSLQYTDSSAPYSEKSTGLGISSSLASSRARELQRITEFEEDNMTRLIMNRKESRRRKRDEADIALGGVGASGRGRSRGGLQDEFRDILQSVGKTGRSASGDGYEDLRQRAKRKSMLERSRSTDLPVSNEEAPRKRARFENAVKKVKKRSSKLKH